MKKIIDGKIYNSKTGESLASYDHNNNGNYSGTSTLMRTKSGLYYIWCDSNGQDGYLRDSIRTVNKEEVIEFLTNSDTTDEQIERLIKLELIKEA